MTTDQNVAELKRDGKCYWVLCYFREYLAEDTKCSNEIVATFNTFADSEEPNGKCSSWISLFTNKPLG